MRALLPAPAPETEPEVAMGRRSLPGRLGQAAIASAVMIAVLLALVAYRDDIPAPDIGDPKLARGLIAQALLLAVVVALTVGLAGLGNVGLRMRGAITSLLLSIPLVALGMLDASPQHLPGVATTAALVLWGVMIGLTEELYGRGLLVTLLGGRRRAELAIIGSAIGFAYLHLPTYTSSYGLRYALLRSTASAAFSASGAVIRLRSGSIVGLVAFHAIDDTRMMLHDFTDAPAHTSADTSDAEGGFVRALVMGTLVTGAYWLSCRREIRRATV